MAGRTLLIAFATLLGAPLLAVGASCDEARYAACRTNADCQERDGGKFGNVCVNLRCLECHYDTDCPGGSVCSSRGTCDNIASKSAGDDEDGGRKVEIPGWDPTSWDECAKTCKDPDCVSVCDRRFHTKSRQVDAMALRQTIEGIFDTARISVPTVLDSMRGALPPEASDQRLEWWSKKLLRDAELELAVRGLEHAGDGTEPLIVMSNHQSLYDIPVLFQSIPGKIRMVAKSELFRFPVWGRAMLAAGFIRIDRSDRDQAIESLRSVGGSLLANGTKVWIAPEGTRSKTGAVGPFKSGGFRMALEMKTRILPVVIDGTQHVLPATGWIVQKRKRVTVTILPPIDPQAYGVERRKELMAEVRRVISSTLDQQSAPSGDYGVRISP
jgi:1-acyl-sn-glycerol-3-phosphate acyltransferase